MYQLVDSNGLVWAAGDEYLLSSIMWAMHNTYSDNKFQVIEVKDTNLRVVADLTEKEQDNE